MTAKLHMNSKVSAQVHFVLCETCFWCASCFKIYKRSVAKCPCCNSIRLKSIPICDNEVYKFGHDPKRVVALELSDIRKRNMNISTAEVLLKVDAKTCVYKQRDRKVTYSVIDSGRTLYLDNKDIISAQLEACERLLKYTEVVVDREAIQKEMAELSMILELNPRRRRSCVYHRPVEC